MKFPSKLWTFTHNLTGEVGWGGVGGENYHTSQEKILALVSVLHHKMQTRLTRRDATMLQNLVL